MTTPSALHSKKTPKWGTPVWLIEYARELLEEIQLDPASSPEFNSLVQALVIYTHDDNGLGQAWGGNVFVNPPGGLVTEFWQKLMAEVENGNVPKAFWVGFSIEQLATLSHDEKTLAKLKPDVLGLTPLDLDPAHPLDFSTCILRKRCSFNNEALIPGGSPSHSNYVTAIGCNKSLFDKLFSKLGKVIHGRFTLD